MNPIFIILVAGQFEVAVEVCHLLNEVGEECLAKVSDMREHERWHELRGFTMLRYCHKGQHEYYGSKNIRRLNCPLHLFTHGKLGSEGQKKRMLSKGEERKEGIRAA